MGGRTKYILQGFILTTIGAFVSSLAINCQHSPTNEITNNHGEIISEYALRKDTSCNHTWIFTEFPNENFLLILNITRPPLQLDVIKILGEDFIEGREEHCRILEFRKRNLSQKMDHAQVGEILNNFTGCKLRSGVTPPVRLTFIGREHFFTEPTFTIEYKAIPVHFDPAPTASYKISPTPKEPSTTNENKHEPPTMTIILGVLGGTVVVLLIFLAAALFIRRKKTSHPVNKEHCQLSDFYQSVPEDFSSKEASTDPVYYNEQANGEFVTNIPHKYKNATKNGRQTMENTPKSTKNDNSEAENVENPLYITHQGVANHSYEYIDIRIPFRRDERRSAM